MPVTNEPKCQYCNGTSIVGVEVRGVYDGVLYWECKGCGGTAHRFPQSDRLYAKAKPFVHPPVIGPEDLILPVTTLNKKTP